MKLKYQITALIFLLFFAVAPLNMAQAQSNVEPRSTGTPPPPVTVDGSLSDSAYISIATKLNANAGFGPNIDVSEIQFYADETNSMLYIGVEGKLDTNADNGIGLWLDFSTLSGVAAGTPLGFDGAGHYMDGQGGGTNDDFAADFEVDYMFAMNPGGGTSTVFLDAAKVVGGNSAQFLGSSDQSGTMATSIGSGIFTSGSVSFAFNNGGGADQGFEIAIPFSELGLVSMTNIQTKAFAFVTSATGFFSDVTVPGNVPTRANLDFNPNFSTVGGGPYNSETNAPTAIELVSFTATAQADGSVLVAWETAAEWNHAGYNVYRSVSAETLGSQVNTNIVAAIGTQGQGASYTLSDADAADAVWYTLEDVDLDGVRTLHGPIAVTASAPTAVTLTNSVFNSVSPLLWLAAALSLIIMTVAMRRRS